MHEHPKFTCRREGHVPQVQFSDMKATWGTWSIITQCARCGEFIETWTNAEEKTG